MKKVIFTSLFGFLILGISFAQSSSIQNATRNWPPHLAKLLQKAQGTVARNAQTPTLRNAALRLDSTLRFIGYDLAAQDSIPVLRTTYQYPKPNVEQTYEDQFAEGAWRRLSRFSETHDQLGRVVDLTGEDYDADRHKYTLTSKLLLYPRGNSLALLDSIVVYAWNPELAQLEKSLLQKNLYNEQNRLVRILTEIQVLGFNVNTLENYSYNAAGENTLIEEFKVFNGILAPSYRTAMNYSNGKLKELTLSLYWQGNFVNSDREVFTYFTGGYRQELFLWDESTAAWIKTQNVEYRSDNWGRTTSVERHSKGFDGEPDSRQQEKYKYITDGNGVNAEDLALEELLLWDVNQGKFVLHDRKHYYYKGISTDVPELEVDAKTLRVYPNPSAEKVYLSLEQDAQVWVYNVVGQLMLSQQVLSGQALELYTLPKGVYYLLAREKQRLYSGKMIKL